MIPIFILGVLLFKYFMINANDPSFEFFGPIPEMIIAVIFLFIAIIAILVPIIIIIFGAFTGAFKKINKE